MIHPAVDELTAHVPVTRACELVGRARGSYYRAKQPQVHGPKSKRPAPPNALTEAEQTQVIEALTSARFCDKSVAQTWATLLDEGGRTPWIGPGRVRVRSMGADRSVGHRAEVAQG